MQFPAGSKVAVEMEVSKCEDGSAIPDAASRYPRTRDALARLRPGTARGMEVFGETVEFQGLCRGLQ